MKAIAEYFRDLAADDRYFGAEPPTPDAEMLQRIAEREIRKRVEAHIGEEGIVLRPEGRKPGLPTAPPPAPEQPAPQPEATAEPAEAAKAAEKEAPPAAAALAPAEPAEADTVAAKLARIRAVVDHARAVTPMPDRGYTEDEEAEAPVYDSGAELPERKGEAATAETEAEAPEEAPEPAAAEEEALAEEAAAPELAATEAGEEPEEAAAAAEAPETAEAEAEAEAEAGRPEEVFESTLSFEQEAELSVSIDDQAQPEAVGPDLSPGKEKEEPREEPTAEAAEEAEEGEEAAESEEAAAAEAPAHGGASEAVQDAATRARARVLKIKRADLEGGPAPVEEPVETKESSGLSPEEEADLMAELAEVEREAERGSRRHGRARLQSSELEEEESAVSRLIETTNTKLEGSEHRRRRTAIAHLKAAVAATVAERRLSRGREEKEAEEAAEMAPYRQDLAKVVRPRRPERRGKKEGKKLAPLMLVSEQRIDKTAAPSAAPARPRRVASGNLALQAQHEEEPESGNIFQPAGNFAEFAEARGARDLSDLLEAAGAYLAEVEGLESFSRPQAMRLVDELREGEISREDRLRAFGRLLREGKFERIKRGQFAVSETSRFRAGEDG